MKQSAPILFDTGTKVRLSAMGTLFFLGGAVGRALQSVPWYVYFTAAVVVGGIMVLLFLRWAEELEGRS